MYLSKSQWAAMRQLAAEAARRVIGTSNKFNEEFQKALDLGFDPFQLNEYCRIVECTARKQAKQNVNQKIQGLELIIEESQNNVREMQVANENLTRELYVANDQIRNLKNQRKGWERVSECRIATNANLFNENQRLKAEIEELRSMLDRTVSVDRRVQPDPPMPRDGDRWSRDGELFTFFMGQWRRRSELEAFSSAKKYL